MSSDDDKTPNSKAPFDASLSRAGDQYAKFTSRVSSVCRTLSITGLGLVWLYADTGSTTPDKLSVSLLALQGQWWMVAALILFVCALAIDIAQYGYGAWRWQSYEHNAAVILQLDNFETNFPSDKVRKAWRSWAGLEVARYTTFTASQLSEAPALKEEPKNNDYLVAAARALLRAATLDEPESPPPGGATKAEWNRIKAKLATAWAPPAIARRVNVLFWLKVLLALSGYLAILVSVVLDLWPHLELHLWPDRWPHLCA